MQRSHRRSLRQPTSRTHSSPRLRQSTTRSRCGHGTRVLCSSRMFGTRDRSVGSPSRRTTSLPRANDSAAGGLRQMSVSTRALASAVAVTIIFDALWVRAPFLGILAVPFLVTAWRYREGRTPTRVALGLWCALYVLICVTYALSNG